MTSGRSEDFRKASHEEERTHLVSHKTNAIEQTWQVEAHGYGPIHGIFDEPWIFISGSLV